MLKGVSLIMLCLTMSGCSSQSVDKYLTIEQQKVDLDREKFEYEKSLSRDKYFISHGSAATFILDKETGEIYKFYITQKSDGTDFGFQPMDYNFGKDNDGKELRFSMPRGFDDYLYRITSTTPTNKGKKIVGVESKTQ